MKKEFIIEGMHCQNCANRIINALQSFKEIKKAAINLETKTLTLELSQNLDEAKIKEKITDLGYQVI